MRQARVPHLRFRKDRTPGAAADRLPGRRRLLRQEQGLPSRGLPVWQGVATHPRLALFKVLKTLSPPKVPGFRVDGLGCAPHKALNLIA